MHVRSRYFHIRLLILYFGIFPFKSIAQDDTSAVNISPFRDVQKDTILNAVIQAPARHFVTGYSIQSPGEITGSVAAADPDKLMVIPAGNIPNQLQGRLAGVNVTGSGQPGMISKVRIRGISSFINNDPLYIVDGVPTQDISLLNPRDVESLCVLKDAGAASIFGSRASGGVIVIETKKGTKGLNISYNMYAGTQVPGKGTAGEMLNTKEYGDLQWLVYENDGITWDNHPIYGISDKPEPSFPAWAAETDWYDEITDPAGIMNHDISVSGGTDNAKFYSGFGYFRQDGIVIHTNSERYNTRFNSEYSLFKGRIKIGENVNFSFHKNLSVPNLDEESPIHVGPYRSQSIIPVVITEPISGVTHDFVPGEWGGTGISPRLGNTPNPVANLTRDKDDRFWNSVFTGSAYLDVTILEGLSFRTTFGGNRINGYGMNYSYFPYEQVIEFQTQNTSSFRENSYYGSDWVWTNLLNFERSWGHHHISALAGYEASVYGTGHENYMEASGIFSEPVDINTMPDEFTMEDMGSISYTPTRLASLFFKADYDFKEKYYLSASTRRDGCSRFGSNDRYGFFPSAGAAWRISNEPFLSDVTWLNNLKIRGSFGITGNQFSISPLSGYMLFSGDIALSYYDINGTTNSAVMGYFPSQIANPDIKWEETRVLNLGFESRLWKEKLGIVFDWYSKKSDDLLYRERSSANIPGTAGETVPPFYNTGSVSNTGVDLEISFKDSWGDLGINTSFLISAYNNKINAISTTSDFFYSEAIFNNMSFARNMNGHPLSSFYGYSVQGLFQTDSEVETAPVQNNAQKGLFRFKNTNLEDIYYDDRQVITEKDKTFIGNPNPDLTYSLDIGLTYKDFDMNAFFYGSYGNEILNWNKWYTDFWPSYQGQKSHDLLYNSWRPDNPKAKTPMATYRSNFATNQEICSYYIEDGSYLRLKSLQLGYTLPGRLFGKTGIKSLRFYLQGVNLFTFTKYSGLDPEIGGPDTCFGVDNGNYPNVRQFIIGLNLNI